MPLTVTESTTKLQTGFDDAAADKKITDKELRAVVDGMRKDGASTKDLDSALSSLAASNPEAAARYRKASGIVDTTKMSAKIEATLDAYSGPYNLGGGEVKAATAFRMGGGANQPTMEAAAKSTTNAIIHGKAWPKKSADGDKLNLAIQHCCIGRGSPAEVKLVTQKLIDAGALKEFTDQQTPPPDYALAIRQMQWKHGIGVDCLGTARIFFMETHGGTSPNGAAGNGLLDVTKSGESLNKHYKKVSLTDAQPGDLVKLEDTDPKQPGHYVTVMKTGTHAGMKTMTVVSSWGAGGDPSYDKGGVRAETWVYDESNKKWGTLEKGTVTWSKTDGPYDHLLTGVYRPTDPVTI